jgi:hypothetical protein
MDQTLTKPWSNGQKIAFRFAFLFLGLTTIINWDLVTYFFFAAIHVKKFSLDIVFSWLVRPFAWLDAHLFHTGYDPKVHDGWPQDNHFATVFYLSLALVSAIAAIVWTVADKRRSDCNELFFWFNFYLRYILAITIIGYGVDKVIPVQMPWPTSAAMLSNYGEQSRFLVLWRFMGMSPGYMILSGSLEVIAGLLLFNRRTLLVGYLLLMAILVNVVALNWFYNIPVKMYSAQLLVYNLYLLVPCRNRLIQFFFFERVVPERQPHYSFGPRWKRRTLAGVLIVFPILFCLFGAIADYDRYVKDSSNRKSEKIYNVTNFVAGDTLPPLMTDTLRWKRLLVYGNRVVVCNMSDKQDRYTCDVDSGKGTFTFHANPDSTNRHLFHYSYPEKDQLQLSGQWKGRDIRVTMKLFPADSIPLNKERIGLIQD